MAALFIPQGTLVDLGVGINMGKRLGWLAGRLDALALKRDASIQALAQSGPSVEESPWSCSNVARTNAFFASLIRVGERLVADDAIERSGEPLQALAHKRADALGKMMGEAAAATD